MQTHFVLQCTHCGAPAADCVPLCPYCGKATGFAAMTGRHGIDKMEGGGVLIHEGTRVEIGVPGEPRECPFCGAPTDSGSRYCEHCDAKIVIERMRVARLRIAGSGSLHTRGGGRLEVVGRRKRAIHEAAERGDLWRVGKEIDDGDDPDFPDANGRRPIHYAAAGAHLEVAQWLVSIGADPDIEDDAGVRPIDLADDERIQGFLEMMGARPRTAPPRTSQRPPSMADRSSSGGATAAVARLFREGGKKKKKKGTRVSRHVFDARGRRVVVGSAPGDGGSELALWCEAPDQLAWAIPKDELPPITHVETAPDRSYAWVGNDGGRAKVALETGAILERVDMDASPWTLAPDGTIVAVRSGSLVRLDGSAELPVWAPPRGALRVASLADRLPGIGDELNDTRGPRPTRLEHPARLLAEADGGLSVLSDTSSGTTWVRYGPDGALVHRLRIAGCESPTDALLDESGRLWAHVVVDARHAIVRVDPGEPFAAIVARSEQRRDFVGFALDPEGTLSLCRGTPNGGGGTLAVRGARSEPPLAVAILVGLVLAQVGSALYAAWRQSEITALTARGESLVITGRSQTTLDPSELATIAPALSAQAGMCILCALGLVLLTRIARGYPVRAMGLALGWNLLVGVLAMAVYAAVMQGNPVSLLGVSMPVALTHLASVAASYVSFLSLRNSR